MRHVCTISLTLLVLLAVAVPAIAQSGNDADRISMRLRTVCNYGQGAQLIIAFDIRQKAGPSGGVVGGYCVVTTYTYQKLTLQGVTQRYSTNYWPGLPWYITTSYGPGAWFNQHSHQTGASGNALPLNSTYFTPATDCSNNQLGDGYFEVLRYQFQVGASAAGTVNFAFYSVIPYKSGISFQHGTQASAIYYAGLQNNGNDTSFTITGLVIPVELAALAAAAREDGSVLLTWRTESETSNAGFEVERGDGENFSTIGFVAGQGTKAHATEYSFIDERAVPAPGRNVVFYRLKQIDTDGASVYSHIVSDALLPQTVGLEQAFPNPVDVGSQSVIPFSLAVPATVQLDVYDALGRKVANLVNNQHRDAGRYEAVWDGRDAFGSAPSGIYFVRFAAVLGVGETVNATRRISVIR